MWNFGLWCWPHTDMRNRRGQNHNCLITPKNASKVNSLSTAMICLMLASSREMPSRMMCMSPTRCWDDYDDDDDADADADDDDDDDDSDIYIYPPAIHIYLGFGLVTTKMMIAMIVMTIMVMIISMMVTLIWCNHRQIVEAEIVHLVRLELHRKAGLTCRHRICKRLLLDLFFQMLWKCSISKHPITSMMMHQIVTNTDGMRKLYL